VFFVISGFVVSASIASFRGQGLGAFLAYFYARRIKRIFPALIVCLLITAYVSALFIPSSWLSAVNQQTGLFAFFGLSNFILAPANWVRAFSDTDLSWLIHCWTLAVEEQFYLLWPWVVLLLVRRVPDDRTRGLALVIGALCIALYRAGMVGIYSDERINYGLDTRMDSLMAGAALAYFSRAFAASGGLGERASRWLGRCLAPGALLAILATPRIVTWYSPWMGRYGYVIVAVASALILADLVLGRHSLLARPLSWAPLVYIGRISYGIYLLHLPIYFIVEQQLPGRTHVETLPLKLALTLAAAALSFHVLEQPFLRLKSRFEARDVAAPRRLAA